MGVLGPSGQAPCVSGLWVSGFQFPADVPDTSFLDPVSTPTLGSGQEIVLRPHTCDHSPDLLSRYPPVGAKPVSFWLKLFSVYKEIEFFPPPAPFLSLEQLLPSFCHKSQTDLLFTNSP